MEAEERPSKLRKLSHDDENAFDHIVAHSTQDIAPTPEAANTDAQAAAVDETSTRTEEALEPRTSAQTMSDDPPLSKNQLKKLRRKQEWEAGRDSRKAKRRDKTKEKKARKRAEKQGQQNPSSTQSQDGSSKVSIPRRRYHLPIAFIIDCGFDDLMIDKERISLGSQLTRAYSDNSKAPFQAHLYVSSWSGELKTRFEGLLKGMYRNWKGIAFTDEDFVGAAKMAEQAMGGKHGGRMLGAFERYAVPKDEEQSNSVGADAAENASLNGVAGNIATQATSRAGKAPATSINNTEHATHMDDERPPNGHQTHSDDPATDLPFPPAPTSIEKEIIYLTSDSPHTLTGLKPYHTYIIGGLVDKNRHKGICYKTAREHGIKTAKLPIGEYMQMTSRFVLATNHVVEIMLRWLECGDWGRAFLQVMPKRKGGVLKEKRPAGDGSAGRDDDDDGDDDGTDAASDEDERAATSEAEEEGNGSVQFDVETLPDPASGYESASDAE